MGFAASANLGMQYGRNHVALLNSDIELPPGWVDRLMAPLVTSASAASTTPFSNAASLCSFPHAMVDSTPLFGLPVERIDSAFQRIRAIPPEIELPTAVGFCMGISRGALDRIGYFDEVCFGRGYGEENDWCRRAVSAGYRNLLAPNLFVTHEGAASFGRKERKLRSQENLGRLAEKHPDYVETVDSFLLKDPLRLLREVLLLLVSSCNSTEEAVLVAAKRGEPRTLCDRHLFEAIRGRRPLFRLHSVGTSGQAFVDFFYRTCRLRFSVDSAGEIEELIVLLPIGEVRTDGSILSSAQFVSSPYLSEFFRGGWR